MCMDAREIGRTHNHRHRLGISALRLVSSHLISSSNLASAKHISYLHKSLLRFRCVPFAWVVMIYEWTKRDHRHILLFVSLCVLFGFDEWKAPSQEQRESMQIGPSPFEFACFEANVTTFRRQQPWARGSLAAQNAHRPHRLVVDAVVLVRPTTGSIAILWAANAIQLANCLVMYMGYGLHALDRHRLGHCGPVSCQEQQQQQVWPLSSARKFELCV